MIRKTIKNKGNFVTYPLGRHQAAFYLFDSLIYLFRLRNIQFIMPDESLIFVILFLLVFFASFKNNIIYQLMRMKIKRI